MLHNTRKIIEPCLENFFVFSETCLKRPLKKKKIGFEDQFLLNGGQKNCKHSALLSTFIKLPFTVKTFVLSIFSGHFRQVLLYL